jgi:hypothetical protein
MICGWGGGVSILRVAHTICFWIVQNRTNGTTRDPSSCRGISGKSNPEERGLCTLYEPPRGDAGSNSTVPSLRTQLWIHLAASPQYRRSFLAEMVQFRDRLGYRWAAWTCIYKECVRYLVRPVGALACYLILYAPSALGLSAGIVESSNARLSAALTIFSYYLLSIGAVPQFGGVVIFYVWSDKGRCVSQLHTHASSLSQASAAGS